jgi:branched-chain amino acid transport system substrate-binding protein
MKTVTRLAAATLLLAATTAAAQAERPDELNLGIFVFSSGPAAAYGMPGRNAAELMIDQINEEGGIDGVPIRARFIDEAQGTDGVVSEFRRLAAEGGAEVMVAALSSANCLALAPVAEQLQMPMLSWNCDTHQLFLQDEYEYVYRTNSSTIPEFIAYALYLLEYMPEVSRIAIINPDYAFGHDAAQIFTATLKAFRPDLEVVAELFPRLGSPSYSTEISRLVAAQPDVIFSNLWGADLENFVRQAQPRGLFDTSQVVLALGETILASIGLPDGVIVGVLGDGWWRSPTAQANEETRRFVEAFRERYGEYPIFPSFKMANSILALKSAYEQAISEHGDWPTAEQLVAAVSQLDIETYTGTLRIREDNDGLVDQIVGITKQTDEEEFPIIVEMVRYPADLVTPPVGVDPIKWISELDEDFRAQLPKPGSYQ